MGYEEHIPGQTRDWNEEIQTTRELPKTNLPERLIRERAIFKVTTIQIITVDSLTILIKNSVVVLVLLMIMHNTLIMYPISIQMLLFKIGENKKKCSKFFKKKLL